VSRKSRKRYRRASGRRRHHDWADYSEQELLDLRFNQLDLTIEGTPLESRIERLYDELEARELEFRPHCWLAEEWFSPDGVPGIAIPFYLAHPRLMRLERKQMLEVEGGSEEWCMKILRHEAGHAIDTAFRLHRRRRWRELFGKNSTPYPDYYRPKPYSRNYVLHLDMWYAQSHPAEDFAETFAVWLKPRSRWRSQYEGWAAYKKLEYVDSLMDDICGQKPPVTSREHVDSLAKTTTTLREHYEEKRQRYGLDHPDFYDGDLRRLFANSNNGSNLPSASAFLRKMRPELRTVVRRWTGEYQYTIDQVLKEMIERCRQLNLRVDRPIDEVKHDALVMLTVQTMNYLHGGHHRLAL